MSEPAKPRRWWRRLAAALLLVVAGCAGWHFWTLLETRRAASAALAELDAIDPGWRLDDLLAQRKPLDDDKNGALVIQKAAPLLTLNLPQAEWDGFEAAWDGWQYPAPLPALLREKIRDRVSKLPPTALPLARSMKDQPQGRFELMFTRDKLDVLLRQVDDTGRVVWWLELDAALRSLDRTADGALESCRAMLHAGRALAGEPFLVSHSVRCRCHMRALAAIEHALANGEASEESLRALQETVAREIEGSDWTAGLRGERAFLVHTLEILDEQRMSYRQFKSRYNYLPTNWRDRLTDHLPHSFAKYLPSQVRIATRMIEAGKLPLHEQQEAIVSILDEVSGQPGVSLMLNPKNMPHIAKSHRRSQTQLRAMLLGLACERYRLQHQAWPSSLESLVDAKLIDAVPLDPNDGKPMRYKLVEKGIVVYGVGADRVDNDGAVRHGWEEPDGADLGFRLRDAPRRRDAP